MNKYEILVNAMRCPVMWDECLLYRITGNIEDPRGNIHGSRTDLAASLLRFHEFWAENLLDAPVIRGGIPEVLDNSTLCGPELPTFLIWDILEWLTMKASSLSGSNFTFMLDMAVLHAIQRHSEVEGVDLNYVHGVISGALARNSYAVYYKPLYQLAIMGFEEFANAEMVEYGDYTLCRQTDPFGVGTGRYFKKIGE